MPKLHTPAGGIPPALYTPVDFERAAEALASANGPIAIDTERASTFRGDDRAFLLQIKRAGTDTFLLAPEGHRQALTDILAPVINGEEWVIHSARNDLPSLAWLGLYPGQLFDTELAGRFAGFARTSLSSMLEEFFDLELEKAYSNVDWSDYPLPSPWLAYAALDVELLLELADALDHLLAEDGLQDWAFQEFDYLVRSHASITNDDSPTWTDLKDLHKLRSRESLAVARDLWLDRQERMQARDFPASRYMSNRAIIEVARTLPRSEREMRAIRGVPRRANRNTARAFAALTRARQAPARTWPALDVAATTEPSKLSWQNHYEASWELYQAVREDLSAVGHELGFSSDLIIEPAALRELMWVAGLSVTGTGTSKRKPRSNVKPRLAPINSPEDLRQALRDLELRPWQAELVEPVVAARLFS